MEEYYFLFLLGGMISLFAIIQDMKEREVANWLNFSFIAIALAYRAFYGSMNSNWNFFLLGVLGAVFMYIVGNGLYYARAFGGGDVKLLYGFGAIWPYSNYFDVLIFNFGFLILLLICGLVWTLIYSVYLVLKEKEKFSREFKKSWKRYWFLVLIGGILFLLSIVFKFWEIGLFVFVVGILWVYVKTLDEVLIVEKNVKDLQEGDWLEKEIRIKGRKIEKSVHGLSLEDIKFLRKYGKKSKILIKDGIPFTPSFLLSLGIMVFFLEVLLSYLSFLRIF